MNYKSDIIAILKVLTQEECFCRNSTVKKLVLYKKGQLTVYLYPGNLIEMHQAISEIFGLVLCVAIYKSQITCSNGSQKQVRNESQIQVRNLESSLGCVAAGNTTP